MWLSPTPIGAYFLGMTDDFEYEAGESGGAILVQPNSVRPISDTILEFTKPKAMKKAQKKLKESGICIQFSK